MAAVFTCLAVGVAASPAGEPVRPQGSVQELMAARIDPAADALWDSVAFIASEKGDEDRRPRTPAEWAAVRQNALTLIKGASDLGLLLATGTTLIIAEPSRSLQNPVFILKMALVLLAAGMTLAYQIPSRRDDRFWDCSTSRRRLAQLLACLSMPLWAAIVFAGRWIAYVQSH